MELQADNFAAAMLGTGFTKGLLVTKKPKENTAKLMWQFSTCLTTLFCAFDFTSNSIASYNMALHPHPGVRLFAFFNGLEDSVTDFNSSYLDIWLHGQKAAISGLRRLGLMVRIINDPFQTEEGEQIVKKYEKFTQELNALKQDFIITNYIQ